MNRPPKTPSSPNVIKSVKQAYLAFKFAPPPFISMTSEILIYIMIELERFLNIKEKTNLFRQTSACFVPFVQKVKVAKNGAFIHVFHKM